MVLARVSAASRAVLLRETLVCEGTRARGLAMVRRLRLRVENGGEVDAALSLGQDVRASESRGCVEMASLRRKNGVPLCGIEGWRCAVYQLASLKDRDLRGNGPERSEMRWFICKARLWSCNGRAFDDVRHR